MAATVRGIYQPYVGDYGGGGPQDVFWYAPGGPDDLWFGHANRRHLPGDHARHRLHQAPPLRPPALGIRYDLRVRRPRLGAIDGRLYTNSLEAFQRNYGRGFRVFEVDLVRLADGTALLAHDGLEANYGLNKPFTEATWADLAGHKYLGRYTILRVQELARPLRQHPDMYVILTQVRPARHLPAHAAARARTQPARAHLPTSRTGPS